MSFIPEHLVEEIRAASDILDVVSDYVSLKKRGANYFGLCPFHSEKTPSFSVNPDKQIFHCFGCSAGGNVFSFIMRHEGVSFPEAARILAKRAGIELPEPETFVDDDASREREALYYANELAMQFFRDQLFTDSGAAARAYMEQRGFDETGLRAFMIGYAPAGWDAFFKYATERQMRPETLVKAGLLNRSDEGRYYDRFRNRIMFPIVNVSGKVIAFGGRALADDPNSPKYVNSPETPIYHKSNVLYGLFQAKEAMREHDEVIFVEGYTDVMRLALSGKKNVVATSGTALTELHARLVKRYTSRATLLYDSDSAGAAAALRGADILIEQGIDVRVAELAEGEDPDSFVRKNGLAALEQRLNSALPLLDFKAQRVTRSADPVGRSEQLHSIVNTLARIQDGILRQEKVRQYAEKMRLDEGVLWEEIGRVRRLHQMRRRRQSDDVEVVVAVPQRKSFAERSKAIEEELVRIMLLHWESIPFIFSFMELTDFYNDDYQLIATVLYRFYQSNIRPEPEELVHYFTEPEVVQFITRVVFEEAKWEGASPNYRKWAADCLAKLQRIMVDMRIEEATEALRERQMSGGDDDALLQRLQKLYDQRRRIKPENFLYSG